jgi:non-ribosomal peptide synthetase component F
VESESLYLDHTVPAIANTRDMLPIRTNYMAERNFKEHVRVEAEALAKANLHRHLSLAELIQLLQLPRDQSRSPLFTAAFRSQKEDSAPVFEKLESSFMLSPSPGARYDIELLALTQDSHTTLVCDFSTELFEADTISRWLTGIVALLDSGLQNASQACGLLPMMNTLEREQILFAWNRTEKSFPRESTVLDLIMEQVQAQPEHIAVRFGESSLSYGQLAERIHPAYSMVTASASS